MLLVSAMVGPIRSINQPQTVKIDPAITVLVGMNEAGKTVFLQALQKSADALGLAKFDPVDDYPRKDLSSYLKSHAKTPADATTLTYELSETEVDSLNAKLNTKIAKGFQFGVTQKYNNVKSIDLDVDEAPVIASMVADSSLSSDAATAIQKASSVRSIPEALKGLSLTAEDQAFLALVEARIAHTTWPSIVEFEAWQWLGERVPLFLYFSDYYTLPSKMNLTELAARKAQATTDPKKLEPGHRGILALLRMADISVEDFAKPGGYEPLKAKIESVSIRLTDQIMEFWKQNEDLEVEIDIKPDSDDQPPFNAGPNLYLRIKNRKHRGVSTPFGQHSHGFIWFFSFLVWFDAVQQQLDATSKGAERDLILLLDEPGLSLHALAQDDFLRYIDHLAKRHQVLYTTHSPFMVRLADSLPRIRVVEDKPSIGTVISENLGSSDPRTLFPLQAAFGWSIAQNLFISERNLIVEGPSDLIYLTFASSLLESAGKKGLRDDVTVVPAGGLDKVVTFVALLGANKLKLAVLHDYRGAPEQKLLSLVKAKMISPKAVLNPSQFRDLANLGVSGKSTDTEDLLPVPMYLRYFNAAFAAKLGTTPAMEADLPPGDRIIERLERWLKSRSITLQSDDGFNHYAVAYIFVGAPPTSLDADTLSRFEALFAAVNPLY